MMALRSPYMMRSVDLRRVLGTTPSSLSDLYRKLEIKFADAETAPERGAPKHIFGLDVRRVLEARGFQFPPRAQIISLMMCKGGVGKTTSTLFLAQRLSAYGARVLAIDADPQGNLTSAFNLERYGYIVDEQTPILVDVITERCTIQDALVEITPLLHLLPSTPLNATLENRIKDQSKNPSLVLSRILQPLSDAFDYILVDCAPALNLTNTATVSASSLVILPVAPDRFSQIGLDQTLHEVTQIETDFGLQIEKKIIFTKFDGREFTSLKYLADIARDHDDRRFSVAIRTCADVKNVITRRDDLFQLKKSNAKDDYDGFAQELMGLNKLQTKRRLRSDAAA
ncbi:MAG: ParA family protein [Cytophagaceae bacterium]|nr:MAG: ParA family protein [Cytophagaceae bacterium]